MIKKIFLALLTLALIAVVVIYFVGSTILNKGVKSGVETYGPRVTQTEINLADVNLSVLSGSGTLKGLHVANPEGFKSENIFALDQIDLKVDTSTLLSDKIVIDHIIIKKPEISYETSIATSNVKQLLKNIEEFTGPSEDSDSPAESDTGAKKKVVIRKLLIEEGSVYVGALGVGETVSLPRIELNDIGEGDQMTMAETVELVLGKVLQNIGPAIAGAGDVLKDKGAAAVQSATEGAMEKVDEATEDAVNKANESIKGLFGN